MLLLTGTHVPAEQLPPVGANDRLLHLLAYGGVGFLAGLRLSAVQAWNLRSVLIWFVLLLNLAALDELTQPWFNRFADFYDWQADAVGLILGFLLSGLVIWFLSGKNHS